MKQFWLVICATFAASVLFQQVSPAAETTAAEDAIRKSAQDFVEFWNHGNAEAIAAQWTHDGEYISGHDSLKGRKEIAKIYSEFFRSHPASKMDVKIESIRVIAPTVAIEQGTASVSDNPNGSSSASSYTAVHVKQGVKWLMASVRESEMPDVHVDGDLTELAWLVGKWSTSKDDSKIALACDWMTNKHFLRAEATVYGRNGALPGGTHVIGRDPGTGQIVSWFFSADGGFRRGTWQKDGSRWVIQTVGVTAGGTPTGGTIVLYRADKNVASWQSFNRFSGPKPLPNVKEVVIERVQANN